jgi:hypothetical protein
VDAGDHPKRDPPTPSRRRVAIAVARSKIAVRGANYHFGSWRAAIESVGIRRLARGQSIERAALLVEDERLWYSVRMIHPDWVEAIKRLELGAPSRRRAHRPTAERAP